jgi:hypothetical protein
MPPHHGQKISQARNQQKQMASLAVKTSYPSADEFPCTEFCV